MEWLEGASYIATIAGVIVVIITVFSYRTTLKQLKKASDRDAESDRRERVKQSIAVLKAFAEKIIPDMAKAHSSYLSEYKSVEQQLLTNINKGLSENQQQTKLSSNPKMQKIVRQAVDGKTGIGDIFNKLEQIAVYMNYDLVDYKLVYGPTHKVFIKFYEAHSDFLDFIRSDEAPYANVTKLYTTWTNEQKLEENQRQQAKLRDEEQHLLKERKVDSKER